jgi:capsular exopolysaccharide synthesis family protein
MSRNFELLTNVAEERELFRSTETRTPPSAPPPVLLPRFQGAGREELAKLVQRVFVLSANGISPRAVAFCGVEHGDGTSWMCAQVAKILAEQSHARICAVDLNLTSPALHRFLGAGNRRGVADAVSGRGPIRDFLEPGPFDNLSVLAAGSSPNPHSVLISQHFRERLAEMRTEFDYLIFDIPPIAQSNDAAVLGRMLDGVVLVVGAHSTRREAARRAKEILEKGHVHLLGTVLNGRTFPIPESLYRRL